MCPNATPTPQAPRIPRPADGDYFTHLECSATGARADGGVLQNLSDAGKPLLARYDLETARERVVGRDPAGLFTRETSLWRYGALLPPVGTTRCCLGEGMTPLLASARLTEETGLRGLLVKDEGQNPGGSFKARGMAVAVSRAKHLGAPSLSVPTAGNAGGALAAYAAAAGIPATVAMPRDAPEANKQEVRAHHAELIEVDGLIGDCGALLKRRAAETGAFDVSTLKEPYRLEGKKTMGYELWEQLDGTLPDVIIYPTGGGTGLIGMWKAFDELEGLGLIGPERPRMVTVQAEGCAPMVHAFHGGADAAEPWEDARTVAGGLRVPGAVGDFLILRALRQSGGTAVSVSDEAIVEGMRRFARAGILVSPEAGATLPAVARLREDGAVDTDERVVLFATGSGLKHPEMF